MSSVVAILPGRTQQTTPLRRLLALVRIAAMRSLRIRYRGSFLGVLWSFANPVMMTAVYTALFGTTFAKYYDDSIVRYVFSVFIGLVVVTFFMAATSEALITVVANGTLLNKIPVPPAVFPLASVAANVFQQALTTFPIVFAMAVVVTHDPLRIVLVPVVLFSIALLTAGFALLLSALFVFFRDLQYLWNITGFILWLTSPMFYPEAVVPEHIRVWFHINPIAESIQALREVTLGHGALQFAPIAVSIGCGGLALVVGVVLFGALRNDFMDLV